MSDNRHSSSANLAEHLGGISTGDLENIIGDVFFEEDIDVELLDTLLVIYSKRDDAPAVDVSAARERFRRDYIGQGEFYLTEGADNPTQTAVAKKSVHPSSRKRTLRYSYVAAALIVIMALFLFATQAGASVRLAIGTWTSETFTFGFRRFAEGINPELESLHVALADIGVKDKLAPTWLPDGFVLDNLSVSTIQDQTIIVALYKNDLRALVIHFATQSEFLSRSYEKDENEVEWYPYYGINHYIMTNNSKTVVVWLTNYYECSISGDISANEARQIIASIYER